MTTHAREEPKASLGFYGGGGLQASRKLLPRARRSRHAATQLRRSPKLEAFCPNLLDNYGDNSASVTLHPRLSLSPLRIYS